MLRLICIDTASGRVNVWERDVQARGGCRLVGLGQISDWHPQVRVDRASLEHFRLNCTRMLEVASEPGAA